MSPTVLLHLRCPPVLRLLALVFVVIAICSLACRGQEVTVSAAQAVTTGTNAEVQSGENPPPPVSESIVYRSIKYAGKYHLMVLHFPIAFLIGAMLVQWYAVVTGRYGNLVTALLWFGTVSFIAAAVLGWMYAYDSVYSGDDEKILLWHRWLGTSTAVGAAVVTFFSKRLGPRALGLALTVCAGLVAAAAHFGGSLVYGADFLKKF